MFSGIEYHRNRALKLATIFKKPFLVFDEHVCASCCVVVVGCVFFFFFIHCMIVSAKIGRKKLKKRQKLCGHNQPNPQLQLLQAAIDVAVVVLFFQNNCYVIVIPIIVHNYFILFRFFISFFFSSFFLLLDCFVPICRFTIDFATTPKQNTHTK